MQSSNSLSKDDFSQTNDMMNNQEMLGPTLPHDSLESRRLSQTNVRASIDMSFRKPQDLHKWAAEAMTARPNNNVAPPLEIISQSTSSLLAGPRRDSEGGVSWSSKLSAPPGSSGTPTRSYKTDANIHDSSFDTVPRYLASSNLELQGGARRENFLSNGLRERPTSMFAVTSPTSESGLSAYLNDAIDANANGKIDGAVDQSPNLDGIYRQGSQRQNGLKSCLKSNNVTDIERIDSPAAVQSTPSADGSAQAPANGSVTFQKSVHISDDLPRLKNIEQSSSGSSPPLSSPLAARLVRRNAAHRRTDSESRSTKRTQSHHHNHRRSLSHSHNSPTLTDDGTYDSEEEEEEIQAVVTPSDEHGPSKGLHRLANEHLPPLPVLKEFHHPLSEKKNITSMTRHDVDKNVTETSVDRSTDPQNGSGSFFSQSTLLDIGREKGLTPPSLHDGSYRLHAAPSFGSTDHTNSVVSTGLGMGLGFRMAPDALTSQIPSTSSSRTLENIEAHYDRFAGQIDLNTMTAGLKLTESQIKSDRAADEISFDELDRDDAELNRRRTTGGLQTRRESRQTGVVGKRRVHRTGTQDPHGINSMPTDQSSTGSAGSFVGHAQLKMTAMHDLGENIGSGDSSNMSNSQSSPSLGPQKNMYGTTSTPLDTPSHGHKANLSPSIGFRADSASFYSRSGIDEERGGLPESSGMVNGGANKFALPAITGNANLDGGLMGIGEVGHFGPGVRAKVAQLIEAFIHTIPLTGQEEETVNMVEYGALNSRSTLLLRPAISSLAKRAVRERKASKTVEDVKEAKEGYFETWIEENKDDRQNLRTTSYSEIQDSQLTFCITHEDAPSTDFRAMTQMLESHRESYMDANWQSMHSPCLMSTIYPTFAARPFASRLAPPKTMHLGISLMDLHWTHTPNNAHVSRATTAQAELTTFLNTRAHEFKKDGMLFLAYIARSEEPGHPYRQLERLSSDPLMTEDDTSAYSISPGEKSMNPMNIAEMMQTPPKKDIWTTLSNTLAPCIQRLVSCGMLKSEVARHLLDLPMHPRTAKQTRSALKSVEDKWRLEWSCGLGISSDEQSTTGKNSQLPNEPMPLRLAHPAWKAFESGCLSRVPFTEHMIQLFKNLYEAHFRNVLREKGRLSKGAVEFVLDSLWDALFSRIVDQSASTAKDIEIEVCIYALRRR